MESDYKVGMDVVHFYGCKKKQDSTGVGDAPAAVTEGGEKIARPSEVGHGEPLSKCRKLLPDTGRRLLELESVWRIFPRQQMAFDFAKNCQQNVAVLAFEAEELGTEGKRKYLVTTYYEFGQQYLSTKCSKCRHYYEVIMEGAACHLYFDLEFKLELNPHKDPVAHLETFIQYVCYQLGWHFGLHCDRTHILDLDSSTKRKFSRHLIFHLPGAVFRNNLHIGNFIHHICDQLRHLKQQVDSGVSPQHAFQLFCGDTSKPGSKIVCPQADQLLALFVSNEKNEKILFCDEGVYTRNRNFRLFLSTKLGKEARLTVARENRFKTSHGESMRNRRKSQLFNTLMDSLVCNVRYERSARVLEFEGSILKQKRKRAKTSSSNTALSASSEEGYSCSPYPQVDQFITSLLTRGGVQGSVRRWTYFPQGKLLVYDIQHNRWCENIGRAHKSNNIMMVADLSRGMYYQKCHDPDCKRIDFRSQEYEIPPQFNPVSAQLEEDAMPGIAKVNSAKDTEGFISDEEFFEKNAAKLSFYESEPKEVATPRGVGTGSSKYELLSDEEFLEELAMTATDVEIGTAVTQSHENEKRDEGCDEIFAEATLEATERLVRGTDADLPGSHTESTELFDSLFSKALNEYERADNQSELQPELQCDSGIVSAGMRENVCPEPDEFDLSLGDMKSFCEAGD